MLQKKTILHIVQGFQQYVPQVTNSAIQVYDYYLTKFKIIITLK